MATESSVMAVIRASRPKFRNPNDKMAFAVHASFLAAGYSLIATGSRACSDNPPTDGEEVGIEGWNDSEDQYGFVYLKSCKGEKTPILVKCLSIGDVLVVDLLNLKENDKEPFHIQINVKDHVSNGDSSNNYGEMYKSLERLVESLNAGIFNKLEAKAGSSAAGTSSSKSGRSANEPMFPVQRQEPPPVVHLAILKKLENAGDNSGTLWSTVENVQLCKSWVVICHDPITGKEMLHSHMWQEIYEHFKEGMGGHTRRTPSSITSRFKILKKELGKWRDALKKAQNLFQSGHNLSDVIMQAQMWYNMESKNKNFNSLECWEVVKNTERFKIVSNGPPINLHSLPQQDSPLEDSPLETDSDMNLEADIEQTPPPRPQGKKASKAKKGNNECAKFLEAIVLQNAKKAEYERESDLQYQKDVEFAKNLVEEERREREATRRENALARRDREEERRLKLRTQDMETMRQDTSNMSPNSKKWWKVQRDDVMRRSSSTLVEEADWLGETDQY